MSQKRVTLFVFLIVFLSGVLSAQDVESEVDLLYHVNKDLPGFSVAVFHGDQIILEKQYGNAHLDYNVPITSETVFDIGSIGKQFTAAAILLLEAEGKLSISDPVHKYIKKLPKYQKGNPTIEHLLNQTSGIKEVDSFLEVVDIFFRDYINQSMLLNIITKIEELQFAPGEYFEYTNSNYILLASIIEEVSGMSYEDYLQKTIFVPLEMKSTLVNIDAYRTIKNQAIGYTEDEGMFYKTHYYSLFYKGDGQIITNPQDMFKWHMGIKNSLIGSPEIWKKMQTRAKLNDGTVIDYGLGVEFETHNGYEAFGFDGMIISGFVSKYLYFPEMDIGFFTTQNTFDWDFRERFFQLVDLFVPKKSMEDDQVVKSSTDFHPTDLKAYEGTYLFYRPDEDRKTNTVKVDGESLVVLTLEGDKIAELIPFTQHKFYFGKDMNAIVEFSFEDDSKQYFYDDMENEIPWVFKEFKPYEHSVDELREYEGHYFNKDFQISKKLMVKDGKLYYYYRNGASKNEMNSISKDLMEIPISPIEFQRNEKGVVNAFTIMGVRFKKI